MTRYRDDKSKVTDPRMTDAFSEGFREGQAMAQNPIMWRLSVEHEGSLLYQAEFNTGVEALSKAATYLDTPGVKISIECRQTPVNAEQTQHELEEGVVEGEVVDEIGVEEVIPRGDEQGA